MELTAERFVNSVFTSNTYVVSGGREAIIIDPGDPDPVIRYIAAHTLCPKAILLTHTHYDHIYGLETMMTAYPGIPVYTSHFGKEALGNPKYNFSRYHDDPIELHSDRIKAVEHDTFIKLGNMAEAKVLATPGHDAGCLTYFIEDYLFTGDSYIPGVPVVATFPKSDKELARKWYTYLLNISSGFYTFPGHGNVIEKQTC